MLRYNLITDQSYHFVLHNSR